VEMPPCSRTAWTTLRLPTFPQTDDALASLAVYHSSTSHSGQSDAGFAVPVLSRLNSTSCPTFIPAFTPSIWFLIFARGVQAVGGGGLVPSSVGIVAEQYPLRRAQAIGLLTSMLPIGSIIGPNLGGYILAHWTWREMFIINVPTASR
jgi:MFS family permease